MATTDKNSSPSIEEIKTFLASINFHLPKEFIEFFKEANGADITTDKSYSNLWPLTDMIQRNKDYNVEKYAPEFFIFGSDGGDLAFVIEKKTGYIFEMPFIGMSKEDANFRCRNFNDFLKSL